MWQAKKKIPDREGIFFLILFKYYFFFFVAFFLTTFFAFFFAAIYFLKIIFKRCVISRPYKIFRKNFIKKFITLTTILSYIYEYTAILFYKKVWITFQFSFCFAN